MSCFLCNAVYDVMSSKTFVTGCSVCRHVFENFRNGMQCIGCCCLNNENMSKGLQKHIDLMKILKKADPQQRKALLQTCEKGSICCLL